MIPAVAAQPRFDHLLVLGTPLGIYEHARGSRPDPRHGYCLDDVGRVLTVVAREPEPHERLLALGRTCLAFTERAVRPDGLAHNRMSAMGRWTDRPFMGDHWGRAVGGLGQLVASPWTPPDLVARARSVLDRGLVGRSRWPRAMAYAAVGAADALASRPGSRRALALLLATRPLLESAAPAGSRGPLGDHWPEPRLTYANALIPEALIAIGVALDDEVALSRGLSLLDWLVRLQTGDNGRLSPVPVGGWAPGEPLPAFDQQPIEVSALAEACWRAARATEEPSWLDPIWRARAWFLGANDAQTPLYDASTGAGHDGLSAHGRNANQGAESTIAALSTLLLAREAEQWLGAASVTGSIART